MAQSSRAANILSSPSYRDSEAASQQLLAEASSPVRHPSAAPSSSAVIGASLLNHARTLTKPPAVAPMIPGEKTGKVPRLGSSKPAQLKPGQLRATPLPKPGKPEKPGKLARASLSSLVSEGPLKKVRGDKMYDIDPGPQKKRPHSLPSQAATLEDEELEEELAADMGDDVVPETSQTQPLGDLPAGSANVTHLPVANAAPQKRRGRPRNSGESTASFPAPEANTHELTDVATGANQLQEGADVEHFPSSPPEMPPQKEDAEIRRGRHRKSGKNTTWIQLSDDEQTTTKVQTESAVPSPKLKRKARVEGHQVNDMSGEPGNKAPTSKKLRRLNGPAMIGPDAVVFDEDSIAPEAPARRDAKPHSDRRAEAGIPIKSTRSRTARAEAEVANAQEHSATAIISAAIGPKAKSAVCQARNARSTQSAAAPEISKSKASAKAQGTRRGAADEGFPEHDTVVSTAEQQQRGDDEDVTTHVGATGDPEDEGEDKHRNQGRNVEQHEQPVANSEGPEEEDGEYRPPRTSNEVVDLTGVEHSTEGNVRRSVELDKVFNFTDPEARSGNCATKLGRAIRRQCASSRVVLSRPDEDCSLDDIAKCKGVLVELLRSIGAKIQDERRPHFKRDAFAYLFRDLTLVLEAMHDKLQEKLGDITESLESIQIVHSYIRELLHFKDTMDGWKVVVQQLTKGDRLIKGVESDLIAPLRVLEKEFGKHLRKLQKAEAHRMAVAEAQRKREVEEQEAVTIEGTLRVARERRNRWQDLHIVRMQCEPDPARRRRLRFVEPVQAAETDANGQPFERIPFFGERSLPPPQWTAASSGREWTDEQETALLDALQSSANLEHIFRVHCRPGGTLRDFSVSDIAAKMAWVRSGWAQLSHQHGWEVPEWVKKIPNLP